MTLNQALKRSSVGVACALSLATGVAQASPITNWGYTTDTVFLANSATWSGPAGNGGGSAYGGTQTQTATELSWGRTGGNFKADSSNASNNRSALTIGKGTGTVGTTDQRVGGGPATGNVNTVIGAAVPSPALGQVGLGTTFTHWNNPIASTFGTLTGASIVDTLTLTPVLPGNYGGQGSVNAPTLTFGFEFRETPNAGDANGFCADGKLATSYTNGCPDLFGFNQTTLNLPFLYADSGTDGILGNNDDFMRQYYASVFVLDATGGAFPIAQLVAGECSALGLNVGCFGFRTAEAAHTTVQFAFAVNTDPLTIPEPGSLALIGLGLASLGALRRRKAN